MNQKELMSIISQLDTRIATINDRTKNHTIQIRDIEKKIKELEENEKH